MRLGAFLWPALALVLALGSGCGAEGGEEGPSGPVTTVPGGRSLAIVAREYTFTPERVSTPGSEPIRIELTNRGSLAHNLRVLQGASELGGTPSFQSGVRSATVRLAPGRYRMVCTVGNHEELGMVGELEVTGR